MSDTLALQRQLKIKSGVVIRLLKELDMYRREEEEQVKRVEKLKVDGADGADIRHAETVQREAHKMVPDAQARLAKAVEDLKDHVQHVRGIAEMAGDPELAKAKEAIEQAEL